MRISEVFELTNTPASTIRAYEKYYRVGKIIKLDLFKIYPFI